MKTLLKALAGGALALAIYLGISYRIVSRVTQVERVELEDTPADYGRWFEAVRFPSRRGDLSLEGWYMPGLHGKPVVVFVHGIDSTRATGGMTELAAMLNARGFGTLTFDLRGCGESGGERMSGGWHERMDVLGAYDYLRARGVPAASIGLIGLSMGAASASLAAAAQRDIRALVLDSPFARASEMVNGEAASKMPMPRLLVSLFKPASIRIAKRLYDIDIDSLAPEDAVATLDYPVLVIAGADDGRIPPEQARRVHEAAPQGSKLWVEEDTAHGETFHKDKARYADMVATYFEARLGRSPTR